ncbi:MAG: 50S ribosomal protein L6 [Aquificaceae bacterium]|nr:50S ribosomal protein L6 [Aquificaceae bacterium]MDW8237750.1 50S ribosomal protein L6 [Aquificaceae bacterium]
MSRLAKKPIPIPKGVKVNLSGQKLTAEGPKGKLELDVHKDISLNISGEHIELKRPSDAPFHRAIHGTMAALIKNTLKGVSEGFSQTLEVFGLGYKVALKGQNLELSLGYSHPVVFEVPKDVKIEVKENKITVSGINRERVGQVCALIRNFKKPDAYKGKGIRYEGEQLKLKPGKSAGKGGKGGKGKK